MVCTLFIKTCGRVSGKAWPRPDRKGFICRDTADAFTAKKSVTALESRKPGASLTQTISQRRGDSLFTPDQIGKILLGIGGIIALVGVVFLLAGRLGLGRLPGDIIIRRENLTVYFPITTMIIVSIILTLIFSLFRR